MKKDPTKVKEIISEWQKNNPSKETLWVIKHGLRSERRKEKPGTKTSRL